MIQIIDPADCCGCTSCASICAHDAITMQPDDLGFLYPIVDNTKCVECGLCEKVCTFNDDYDISLNLSQPDAYAARHKNMDEVETSRSGAAFIAISDWIIAHNGVVYGVGYADHFRVVHKRALTKKERDEFKGSKYVQSDLSGIYRQVKQDLKDGRIVLFSGTPCQTSALRSYLSILRVDIVRLYVIDVVCHGVPSPYYWRDYLAYVEKKQGMKAIAVNFRDKSRLGWAAHKESFTFENGITYTYTYTFYQHIVFRRSCGVCHYANLERPSDITIADFWGWEKVDLQFNADDKGLSLIMCNTKKGKRLFEAIKNDLNYVPAKLEDCIQPNMVHPSEIHPKRMKFEKDYQKKGFIYVHNKYAEASEHTWHRQLHIWLGAQKNKLLKLIAKK